MQMTEFEEQVWKYMVSHKTPVTIKKMAKYWICSESRVRKVLDKFVEAQIADLVKTGNLRYYKVKD
jgi:MarR-like DNA-binding transcriptional regulator SgrR of sgrS sRNA